MFAWSTVPHVWKLVLMDHYPILNLSMTKERMVSSSPIFVLAENLFTSLIVWKCSCKCSFPFYFKLSCAGLTVLILKQLFHDRKTIHFKASYLWRRATYASVLWTKNSRSLRSIYVPSQNSGMGIMVTFCLKQSYSFRK